MSIPQKKSVQGCSPCLLTWCSATINTGHSGVAWGTPGKIHPTGRLTVFGAERMCSHTHSQTTGNGHFLSLYWLGRTFFYSTLSGIHPSPVGVWCVPFFIEAYTMNRENWKNFYRWLDTANRAELNARHEELSDLIRTLRDREVRANAVRGCAKKSKG